MSVYICLHTLGCWYYLKMNAYVCIYFSLFLNYFLCYDTFSYCSYLFLLTTLTWSSYLSLHIYQFIQLNLFLSFYLYTSKSNPSTFIILCFTPPPDPNFSLSLSCFLPYIHHDYCIFYIFSIIACLFQ